MAAKIRVMYDRKRGVATAQWIKDLAAKADGPVGFVPGAPDQLQTIPLGSESREPLDPLALGRIEYRSASSKRREEE